MRKLRWSKARRAKFNNTITARKNNRKKMTELSEWGKELQREEIRKNFKVEEVQVTQDVGIYPPITLYTVKGTRIIPVRIRLSIEEAKL